MPESESTVLEVTNEMAGVDGKVTYSREAKW